MVDHSKDPEIPYGELLQDCSQNIQEAIKMAEFYPHAFLVAQQWFNVYGPGQNQEPHNHVPSHLSGVYYMKYDKEFHNSTTYMNPNKMFFEAPRYNKHYYDPELCGYGCYKEEMTLQVDEGDVVIFPSQLEHMVQRQPGIEAQQRLGGNPQMDQKPGDYPTTSIPTEGGPPTPEGNQSGEWSSDWF